MHAIVAGLDYEVYLALEPLVDEILKVDVSIGQASLAIVENEPGSLEGLAKLYNQTLEIDRKLSRDAAKALQPYSIKNSLKIESV